MTINFAGVGWYEFIKHPEATTHIIHIHENGDAYIPEAGIKEKDFMDALIREQAWRLVREAPTLQEKWSINK